MVTSSDELWWLHYNDQKEGPVKLGDIAARLRVGTLSPMALGCPEGGQQWKPLYAWPQIARLKQEPVIQTPPPPPPGTSSDTPQEEPPDTPCAEKVIGDDYRIPMALALGGLAVVGILYFWFVLVLWVLLCVSILVGIGCLISAAQAGSNQQQHRIGLGGAVLAGMVAWSLWSWIGTYGIDIPNLSSNATAREITREYRNRVAHVRLAYNSTRQDMWGSTIEEGIGTGSGLLIANDHDLGVIITNRHVVDPVYTGDVENVIAAGYEISLASEDEWYEARVAAIHRDLDLAILTVRRRFPSKGAVRVASMRLIEQGEDVVALGNPVEIDFVTTEGIVSKVAPDVLLTSCPINPGNSGGPLISKNKGLVVGFNTWSATKMQNFNVAILADRVFRKSTPVDDSSPNGFGVVPVILRIFHWTRNTMSGGIDETSWNWYADREQVVELLKTVPFEKPKK